MSAPHWGFVLVTHGHSSNLIAFGGTSDVDGSLVNSVWTFDANSSLATSFLNLLLFRFISNCCIVTWSRVVCKGDIIDARVGHAGACIDSCMTKKKM